MLIYKLIYRFIVEVPRVESRHWSRPASAKGGPGEGANRVKQIGSRKKKEARKQKKRTA